MLDIAETNVDFLPEDYAIKREVSRLVMEIVDSLSEMQRMAVILYYYDGLSVADVSRIMEVSEGTTMSRLNYARRYIKSKVEELEKEGTKLYGFPVLLLIRMLQDASLDYGLPQGLSDQILANALKAADAVGTAEADAPSDAPSGTTDNTPTVASDSAGRSTMKRGKLSYLMEALPMPARIIVAVIATAIYITVMVVISNGLNALNMASSKMRQVEVDTIVGLSRKGAFKLLGKPDSGMEKFAKLSKDQAIDRLWDMDLGVGDTFGLSKQGAKENLKEEDLDELFQHNVLYSDKTHLTFTDKNTVKTADFYTDKYSFRGIKVGMALSQAYDILRKEQKRLFMGYNWFLFTYRNVAFMLDSCTIIIYYDNDEIIRRITLML